MRKLFAIILLLAAISMQGKDIDLKKYGAKADGKTKVTAILQKAIDEVSAAGGGRVILSGGTFLITPFEIKSGVDLHIEADATLLASPDIKDYPDRENPRHYLSEAMPRYRNASIIYADEAENIAITGRGTIDCNGKTHVREKTDPDWSGMKYERVHPYTESLPRVVFFAGCKGVTVSDITMTNQPAGWSFWINDCDRVRFDRVNILADVHYPNNDGIHINCSRDVAVSNCFIETGDDAIIIRANSRSLRENKACERVVVTNCTLHSWSCAVRLGWSNDGVMRDCTLSNLVIFDSCRGISLCLPEPNNESNDYGREATRLENITVANVQMDEIYGHPIDFEVSDSENVLFAGAENITFSNINCRKAAAFPYLSGRKDAPLKNIVFDNCYFEKVPIDSLPIPFYRHGFATMRSIDKATAIQGLVFIGTSFVSKD